MHRSSVIAVRYALFAAAATGVNLTSQWAGLRFYDGSWSLPLAMALGTATGLATKYVLDKRWIFNDTVTGLKTHMRKFSLYTLMGIVTTAIFWITELLFDALSRDGRMRFIGAVIGLAIGYFSKYRLDRRFVFGAPS